MSHILSYIKSMANKYSNKNAIVTKKGSYSYSDLWMDIEAFANYCIKNGLEKNDRVCIYSSNTYESVIAALGTLKSGGVFVFISPNTPLVKLEEILQDCDCSAIISNYPVFIKKNVLFKVSVESTENSKGWIDFDQCIIEQPTSYISRVNDLATIIYTSGSTGHPKGIISSNENILFSTMAINKYLNHSSKDKVLSYLPLSFDYGLYQIFLTLSTGATLYLRDSKMFITEISHLISDEMITGLPGLRSLFAYFSHFKFKKDKEFGSVRYITNTGDALPNKMINDLSRIFPNGGIYSMYGLSECKRVSYLPPKDLKNKPDSVGVPLDGTRIYILNEEGAECLPFEHGELFVSGPNVCQGYWNNESETKNTFISRKGEKVLKTGDICYLDNEGYLYFVSRKDSMFKSKGYRIEPKEIENLIIEEFSELNEAVVVGVPDQLTGNRICLLSVCENPSEKLTEKIKKYCKDNLEPWKVPSHIIITDSLPLSNSGKLDRKNIINLFSNEEEKNNVD